ncbi:condensation domain-containing protein [Burkholderia sp. Ax-1724]|uniref:condensation domain-containing protein n=1 Tax=Burkholderia sp. Ax-1724 TaxID=2608336 RepID=UPI0014243906|nr:condensation domain-containing protein [Burkholderia sp. Ax-1724]NIF50918.1 AMP-binding protein [Burkholderia sp. Ax-1724]
MSSIDFINELAGRGIELWTQDGKLQYKAPRDAVTPGLLAELKQHKATLIALLEQFAGTAGSYPLSYAQKSLWSLHQLDPGSAAYNVTYATRLDDAVDLPILQRCIDYLIARHPILRTVYRVSDGQPRQQVSAAPGTRFMIDRVFDADTMAIHRWIDQEANLPFDLSVSPIRMKLLVNEHGDANADVQSIRYVLLLNVHHIAADFWSLEILIRELHTLYQMAIAQPAAEQPLKLPRLALQYKDCVQHETDRLQGDEGAALAGFWQRELQGELPVLNLATDRIRTPLKTEHGRVHSVALSVEVSRQIRETARSLHVTPYMLLLAVYQLFLFLHTGQSRLMIGAPTSGRSAPGSESVLGHFVNTVVLACEVRPDDSFGDLVKRTREMMLRVLDHQDYPFPLLVETLRPPRDPSRSPVYQVMYNWNQARNEANTGRRDQAPFYRELLAASSTGTRGATHDLTLNVQDMGTEYVAAWTFNTDLFDHETIDRFASQYARLVEQILADPARRTVDYRMTAPPVRDAACWRIADAHVLAKPPSLQCGSFFTHASRKGEQIAWRFDRRAITYAELSEAVHAVRSRLQTLGIGAGSTVSLQLRSIAELAAALLAVLEVGASCHLPDGSPHDADALHMRFEAICRSASDGWSDWNPYELDVVKPQSRVEARGVYEAARVGAFIDGMSQLLQMDEQSRALVLRGMPVQFALSIMVGAVRRGGWARVSESVSIGALVGDSDDRAEWARLELSELIAHDRISALAFPALLLPSLTIDSRASVNALIAYGNHPHTLEWVARCQSAPKARYFAPVCDCDAWKGPVAFAPVRDEWQLASLQGAFHVPVALGPFMDLADERQRGRLCLVSREVCALRSSVATDDDLSHLLAHTGIVPTSLTVTWRAGHMVCADPSGRVVTHRLAPFAIGDVERFIASQQGVREAVCHVVESDDAIMLTAYVVPIDDDVRGELESALRGSLKRGLPDYTHPEAFVMLEALPLDRDGALDVSRLPPPQRTLTANRAAATDIERKLAAIWCEVLGKSSVSIDDDFFVLGGDSILAAVIVSKASLEGMYLKPKDIFEQTTIAGLARVVSAVPGILAEQGSVTGEVMPGPASQWFFDKVDVDRSHFNQALLLSLREAPDPTIMQEALRLVVRHHDVLRSRFEEREGGWRQVFVPDDDPAHSPDWAIVSCTTNEGEPCAEIWSQAIADAQAGLDIERGRLLSVRWLESATLTASRLLIVVHHLAIDGVSWNILLQDIGDIYLQLRAQSAVKLPLKTSSTKAWVEQWDALVKGAVLDSDRQYWQRFVTHVRGALAGPARVTLMRHGLAPIVHHTYNEPSGGCTATLDAELTEAFRTTAHQAYGTDANDLLIAALHAGFRSWSGSDALLVDLEGHGRDALADVVDLSRSIGWFTSIYPVFIEATPYDDPGRLIKHVKERLRQIPRKGASFGALRYLEAPRSESQGTDEALLASLPNSPILFTYLGQLDQIAGSSAFYGEVLKPAPGIRSARQRRTHLLDVTAYIADGRLTIESGFHGAPGIDESIGCLMCRVSDALTMLIRHCCTEGAGGLTPSDVPQLDVNQDGLDELLDEIEALER